MAKTLTRDYLEYLGITEIDTDGTIYTKHGPKVPQEVKDETKHYKRIQLYVLEEDKCYNLYVHRVVYAWFNKVLPGHMEVHHIDLNGSNNAISNLQCLTHAEHVKIHREIKTSSNPREEKCRLDIPRTWYVKKLNELNELPDSESKRSAVYHMQSKIRYYDAHIEEATKLNEFKKDLLELEYWKDRFKEAGNKTMWHECCKVLKLAKEKKLEAAITVEHALDVIHKTFSRYIK